MIRKFQRLRPLSSRKAVSSSFSFCIVSAFGMIPDASASRSLYSQIHANSNAFNQGWLRADVATVTRSVRDIDDDKSKLFSEAFQLSTSPLKQNELHPIQSNNFEIVRPIFQDISPSGKLTISMKLGGKSDDIPLINLSGQETSHYLDVSDYHGKFVGDIWFGGISWSQDERYVAYVAYKKENVEKKAESGKYFEYRNSLDGVNKFEYVDDWGEKYVGLVSLSLNVLNTETGEVSTVEGVDDNIYTVGQPVFLPDCNGHLLLSDKDFDKKFYRLAYTAWKNGPKKLGMIYCYQRESSIFVVDLTEQLLGNNQNSVTSSFIPAVTGRSDAEVHVLVTKGVKLARSARFSPSGSEMVFLGNTEGFASHNGCSELLNIRVSDILKSLKTAQTRNKEVNGDAEKGEKRIGGEVQDEERTKITTIVRTVPGSCSSESSKPDNTFPGIYADQLPRNCFLTDDCVIMSSPWGSVESTIIVELSTKIIHKVQIPYKNIASENEGKVSTVILDIQNSINNRYGQESYHDVLLSISTPSSSQVIGVLRVTLEISRGNSSFLGVGIKTSLRTPPENYKPNLMPITRKKNAKITNISPPLDAEKSELEKNENENENKNVAVKEVKKIDTIDFNKMLSGASNFNHLLDWKTTRYHDDNGIPFESILISPKQGQNGVFNFETPGQNGGRKCPLIVVPHGGPHSCMTTSYIASYAFLALYLGAAVLHVNYRGSTGFGQDSIDYLLGKIGTSDVADMMSCTMDAIGKNDYIDAERVAVVGGSHGGFLAAHLVGQHPELFKVACMRNPVTDLPSMLSVTDIPDWCFVEALGTKEALKYSKNKDNNEDDFNTMPSSEDLIKMRECSPIIYVKNVRAPVLMLIGGKDRRVPMSQGVSYYHNLKAKGVTTKLLVFPEDVHAIDRPLSEAEQWIAIASWLETHLL